MNPMKPLTLDRRKRRSAGQSLVEFTLIFPIFMLIVFGVFDGGRLIYMNTVLSQSAREAARVVAVEASWMGSNDPSCNQSGGPVCPANLNALIADADAAANRRVKPFGIIPTTDLFISCDALGGAPTGSLTTRTCTSSGYGNVVTIRVRMSYSAVTPVIGQLLHPITLTGDATMVIN
jgi:Flp pilus assembly protein TadG